MCSRHKEEDAEVHILFNVNRRMRVTGIAEIMHRESFSEREMNEKKSRASLSFTIKEDDLGGVKASEFLRPGPTSSEGRARTLFLPS